MKGLTSNYMYLPVCLFCIKYHIRINELGRGIIPGRECDLIRYSYMGLYVIIICA